MDNTKPCPIKNMSILSILSMNLGNRRQIDHIDKIY